MCLHGNNLIMQSKSWDKFCDDEDESFNYLTIIDDPSIINSYNSIVLKYQKILHPVHEKPIASHISCPSCNSNLIYISSRQVRSADEGATMFCKCYDCKKSWTAN
jgi:DNA-directed RNA polymerase subunit M/transcription elongation factor TFIIS